MFIGVVVLIVGVMGFSKDIVFNEFEIWISDDEINIDMNFRNFILFVGFLVSGTSFCFFC